MRGTTCDVRVVLRASSSICPGVPSLLVAPAAKCRATRTLCCRLFCTVRLRVALPLTLNRPKLRVFGPETTCSSSSNSSVLAQSASSAGVAGADLNFFLISLNSSKKAFDSPAFPLQDAG